MSTVAWRLTIAAFLSAGLVLAAPFMGEARSWLRARYPGQVGLILNGAVTALAATALAIGLARIRTRRLFRFGCLAIAVGLAAAFAAWSSGDSALSNAAERFHFISYGLVTWLFFRAFADADRVADPTHLVLPAGCALLVGTADEAFQWLVPGRVGEVRDVFLNAGAILAGLIFSLGLAPPVRWRLAPGPGSRRRLATVAVFLMGALAAFVHAVHLGEVVQAPTGERFLSRFSAKDLEAAARERAARWATSPPPLTLRRWSLEDQYLAEAVWHIQARNSAWTSDVTAAWHENALLERFFAPVLDTPSYAAPVSRWPAAQAEDARRRATPRAGYVSHAPPLPIWAVSPASVWAGAVGLAGLILWWQRRRP